ncbi:hypothetical protein Pr1d_30880 [Bythopirellula goksoeyrii]|uniref:Uncharacterized protein n=1 Tax=Bythopirellula goksoeyrii TaxID=1400387 RepID=A0A5B9QE66_9BACT|nr:hypothetical protein Pr1d_30880 [Bythopirellula goksoeyrii]
MFLERAAFRTLDEYEARTLVAAMSEDGPATQYIKRVRNLLRGSNLPPAQHRQLVRQNFKAILSLNSSQELSDLVYEDTQSPRDDSRDSMGGGL